MIKGWEEDEDETGQNFAICNQTRLDDIAHEQTIICGRLFAGHVVGSRPMKREKKFRRMIIAEISYW